MSSSSRSKERRVSVLLSGDEQRMVATLAKVDELSRSDAIRLAIRRAYGAIAERPEKEANQLLGWLICHPDGSIETDYFQRKTWSYSGARVTRETWRRKYRPECRMVRATLSWGSA